MTLNELVTTYKKTRDEEIFNAIYEGVYPIMKGKASQYTVAGNDFEDNVSELSRALLKCIDKFDETKANFNTFFNTIAKNTMLNLIQAQSIRIQATEDINDHNDDMSYEEDELIEVEFIIDLDRCDLSDRNKAIVHMLVFENKSQKEVADILNISKGRVTQIISGLREQLGQELMIAY